MQPLRPVETTQTLLSRPRPRGHYVMLVLLAGTRVHADMPDEDGARDVTDMLCDLIVLGLEHREAGNPSPTPVFGQLRADPAPPQPRYVHPDADVDVPFDWEEACDLARRGAALLVHAADDDTDGEAPGGAAEGTDGDVEDAVADNGAGARSTTVAGFENVAGSENVAGVGDEGQRQ